MCIDNTTDTVFALSTPVGGAIAVFRVTGSDSKRVLSEIFTGKIEPRLFSYGRLVDGENTIDEVMAVYFKGPASYTGEDMFEVSIHGSYAVSNAVSQLLARKGLRMAAPGEFTKRAFMNGKMDLVQADAVMDLILSDTKRSADAALEQLKGSLSREINSIEELLIDFMSELFAAMDYPEEMEDEVMSDAEHCLAKNISKIEILINNGGHSRILREGARVVIVGKPNVGKSSLMNVLTGTERAIVTKVAGTTRDIIEEKVDICGIPVRLTDTAGMHDAQDEVEVIGIERAVEYAQTAEVILAMFDGTAEFSRWDCKIAEDYLGKNAIAVINKADIDNEECEHKAELIHNMVNEAECIVISCETGEGIDKLCSAICSRLGFSHGERAIVTNERHIECLIRAREDLIDAQAAGQTDLAAVSVQSALSHLGEITGREVGEDVLDRIFSRFCVGK